MPTDGEGEGGIVFGHRPRIPEGKHPLQPRCMKWTDLTAVTLFDFIWYNVLGVTKPRVRISASMTFSRSNPSELPMVSRVCSFHKTFPTGAIRSKKLISGRFHVQRSEGNRLNSQSDDPGTGNFPRMSGGVSAKPVFLRVVFTFWVCISPMHLRGPQNILWGKVSPADLKSTQKKQWLGPY